MIYNHKIFCLLLNEMKIFLFRKKKASFAPDSKFFPMKNLLLLFITLFFLNINVTAQDSLVPTTGKFIIGITPTPPFVVEEREGFGGISIRSWEMVNDKLEAEYEYRVYDSLGELLAAVENAEVDFSINPITVTDQRMLIMDFSQPYFISHTAMAQKSGSRIWGYITNILSWNFISALLILIGVIFIFGLLVWLFERKKNQEQFGGGLKGIYQGFWWSAVTMTTVGYGDKSPLTLGGRVIGFIWMFMAIIMISSLTAGIASSLTVQNMNSKIRSIEDLGNFEITTVQNSSALELLEQYNIDTETVANAEDGIQQLLDEQAQVFVYDQPILQYYIEQKELEDKLEVLQRTLKKDYYSYAFPTDSKLIKVIDPLLIATLKTMTWNNLVKDYK